MECRLQPGFSRYRKSQAEACTPCSFTGGVKSRLLFIEDDRINRLAVGEALAGNHGHRFAIR